MDVTMSDPIVNNNINQINQNDNIQPNEDKVDLEKLPLELLKPKESKGWLIFTTSLKILGCAALTIMTAGFAAAVMQSFKVFQEVPPSLRRMPDLNTGDPDKDKHEKPIDWKYKPSQNIFDQHKDEMFKPIKKEQLSLFAKPFTIKDPAGKKGTQELCNLMAEFKDGHHPNDWIFNDPVAEFAKHVGNDIADKIITKKLGKEYILDVEGQRELTLKAIVCRKLTIDRGGPEEVAKLFEGKNNKECYDLVVETLNRLAQPYAEEINLLHNKKEENPAE